MPSPEDCGTLTAYFEGVEEARREVEVKWGVGRAELLASDELRARWRRQCVGWKAAYWAAWDAPILTRDLLQAVHDKSASMRRGYAALDASAEHLGHRPIAPWVWECLLGDGSVAAIVQTNAEAGHVIAEGRYLVVYTLAEVGNVISALPEALQMAKQAWPGSKFRAPKVPNDLGAGPWSPEGDEIPFERALATASDALAEEFG